LKKRIQTKIDEIEKIIAGKKENFTKIADQISEIERQISEIERAKQKIQSVIDRRFNMKATFNGLIELVSSKLSFFLARQAELNSLLAMSDFYTVFIAAYISYAPLFTSKIQT
jgi:chromosome segregation ATPase